MPVLYFRITSYTSHSNYINIANRKMFGYDTKSFARDGEGLGQLFTANSFEYQLLQICTARTVFSILFSVRFYTVMPE